MKVWRKSDKIYSINIIFIVLLHIQWKASWRLLWQFSIHCYFKKISNRIIDTHLIGLYSKSVSVVDDSFLTIFHRLISLAINAGVQRVWLLIIFMLHWCSPKIFLSQSQLDTISLQYCIGINEWHYCFSLCFPPSFSSCLSSALLRTIQIIYLNQCL